MEKSKLIRVLTAFSTSEKKEMRKFLASPFFNQREDLCLLYDHIITLLASDSPEFDKQKVFIQLFPTVAYSISKIDLLMSYLFQQVQQYLTWKAFSKEANSQKLYTAKAFKDKGLHLDFQQTMDKLEQSLENQSIRNAEFYRFQYQLQWEKFQATEQIKPEKEGEKWRMMDTFDIGYLTTKLKHQCLLKAHQSVYQLQQDTGFLAEILSYIEQGDYLKIPAINLYYHCYLMLDQPSIENHFIKFKKLLFQLNHYFSASEKRVLLLMGINYCVRQSNEGKSNYIHELLELYQGGLSNQYLLEKGELSRFTYHNIVGVGIATDNLDWAANFIEQYKSALEKKERESTYSFSLARLAYHRKEYNAVLQLLQKSNYRDLLLNLAAKTLLLKIYVEQDQDTSLYAHLEAMQRYIRRKHVIGYHKKNYLNIIKYTKKMRGLNFFDKTEVKNFKAKIQAEEVLTEKSWFLQQLERL